MERNGIYWLHALRKRIRAVERLWLSFHKIYNIAGLLITNDILDIMGYVAYKPHAFSWFMWFINPNLHIKRRSFSSRFTRAKPKLKVCEGVFA